MAYNILLMGASYGSLLASKILFGGPASRVRPPVFHALSSTWTNCR